MPRIDPKQLLKTIRVLLAPDGGIKSKDEVARLAKLMQKFSKKLVSKCIYIHILKSTSIPLLGHFLQEEGWDLMNSWFLDFLRTRNWALTRELLSLFLLCPVTPNLLRSKIETNQAPRIVNQIRNLPEIDQTIRLLAEKVYTKWVNLIAPPIIKPKLNIKSKVKQEKPIPKLIIKVTPQIKDEPIPDPPPAKVEQGSLSLLQSLAEEVSYSLKKEDPPPVSTKKELIEESKPIVDKKVLPTVTEVKPSKHDKIKKSSTLSTSKRKKEELESLDIKRARTDRPHHPKDAVGDDEKQRIKAMAKKLKEEAQAQKDKDTLKLLSNSNPEKKLAKIPRIPKKSDNDQNKKDSSKKPPSFAELLGGLDAKPKTVKTPMNKNKTAALLEGLSKSTSISKPQKTESSKRSPSSLSHKSAKDSHNEPSNTKKHSVDKKSPEVSSPKAKNLHESSSFMDAIFSSINNDAPIRKKKRRLSDKDESKPKEFVKSNTESPEAQKLVEENETPEAKKQSSKVEEVPQVFSFYRDTLDQDDESKDESTDANDTKSSSILETTNLDSKPVVKNDTEDPSPEELEDSLPRQVKGILVYHRGKDKRNKCIKWKPDSELTIIKLFEMDDTERVNVNKLKYDFSNMRKMEFELEKAALQSSKESADLDESLMSPNLQPWYTPVLITVDNRQSFTPGRSSKEREIQAARELKVLQAIYFSKTSTPDTPDEPDLLATVPSNSFRLAPVQIPLEDNEGIPEDSIKDFKSRDWPVPKPDNFESTSNNGFSLSPSLSNFLSNFGPPTDSDITAPPFMGEIPPQQNLMKTDAQPVLGPASHISQSYQANEVPPHIEPAFRPAPVNVPNQEQFHNQGNRPSHDQEFNYNNPPFRNFNHANGRNFNDNGGYRRNDRNNYHNNYYHNKNTPHHDSNRHSRDNHRRRDYNSRPCRFFTQKGHCREGDRCRFAHEK